MADVARALNVSRATVLRWIEAGVIRASECPEECKGRAPSGWRYLIRPTNLRKALSDPRVARAVSRRWYKRLAAAELRSDAY